MLIKSEMKVFLTKWKQETESVLMLELFTRCLKTRLFVWNILMLILIKQNINTKMLLRQKVVEGHLSQYYISELDGSSSRKITLF